VADKIQEDYNKSIKIEQGGKYLIWGKKEGDV
jgi:hypothetical protein